MSAPKSINDREKTVGKLYCSCPVTKPIKLHVVGNVSFANNGFAAGLKQWVDGGPASADDSNLRFLVSPIASMVASRSKACKGVDK